VRVAALQEAICIRIIARGIIPRDIILCNKPLQLVGFESLGVVRFDEELQRDI
jgi:hypothetical protein